MKKHPSKFFWVIQRARPLRPLHSSNYRHPCQQLRLEHAPVILDACPTPRGYRMTADGPRPRACRRLACGYCGPRLALSTVKAIELAAPIGSAVVTLPHAKLPEGDRVRLRAFAQSLGPVSPDLREAG